MRHVTHYIFKALQMNTMVLLKSLTLPQAIFVLLPLALFFKSGVVYTLVIVALVALAAEGQFDKKLETVKAHPFTLPVLVYSGIMLVAAVLSDWSREDFWSHLGHYLTYIFLLCFLAMGGGKWKQHALRVFYGSALAAATIFYGTLFDLFPAVSVFESFVIYNGGKSILLGILLAVAIGWMLLDLGYRFSWVRLAAIVYMSGALLFVAKGRVGYILFLLAVLMNVPKLLHLSRKLTIGLVLGTTATLALAWNLSTPLHQRTKDTIADLQQFSETRVHETSTGLRMQMYVGTTLMALEKPVFGYGMGSWKPEFHARYGHKMIGVQVTPHNEYLQHVFETGLFGLSALIWLWWMQWRTGRRQGGEDGSRVVMLTAMMVVAALFNAIIRDGTYAMAFMVLLAIPLAGANKATTCVAAGSKTA